MYTSGCGCRACTDANAAYQRRLRAANRRGRLVDATPSAEFVLLMEQWGMGYRSIAAAADLRPGLIASLAAGRVKRVVKDVPARLNSVVLPRPAGVDLVPAELVGHQVRQLSQVGVGLDEALDLAGLEVLPERGAQAPAAAGRQLAEHQARLAAEGLALILGLTLVGAAAEIRRVYHRTELVYEQIGDLLGVSVPPQAWMRDGACRRPGVDSRLFFADPGNSRTMARAKAVCFTCPVLEECQEFALANREPFGVFGAMTAAERKELLEVMAALPAAMQVDG